jgi:hypothetical protein
MLNCPFITEVDNLILDTIKVFRVNNPKKKKEVFTWISKKIHIFAPFSLTKSKSKWELSE